MDSNDFFVYGVVRFALIIADIDLNSNSWNSSHCNFSQVLASNYMKLGAQLFVDRCSHWRGGFNLVLLPNIQLAK